jgi:hypothetical protein
MGLFQENYNCFNCTLKYKDPKIQRSYQESKSCFGGKTWQYQIENIQFKCCPGNFTLPMVSYLLEGYRMFKNLGVLPEKGGLFDQTYKTIEIFQTIGTTIDLLRKKEEDILKKRKKK